MADNGALSCRQRRFLQALLTSKTIREAARLAHVGERTAWRWLRDPTFKAELRQMQDAHLAEVTRVTVAGMTQALETLEAVMGDPSASPSAKVSAARTVLEMGVRFTEILDLAERVAVLEQRLGGTDGYKA